MSGLLGLNFISLVGLADSGVPFSFMREIFRFSITLGRQKQGEGGGTGGDLICCFVCACKFEIKITKIRINLNMRQ